MTLSLWGRQPAVLIAFVVALIQAIGIFVMNDASFTFTIPEILLPILTTLGGFATQRKVVPVKKLELVAPSALYKVEQFNQRNTGRT